MPRPGDGVALNTIERCGLECRYLRVTSGPQRGRYVHQLVAEAMLGRALMAFEEVDHVDGNTLNNHFSNLQVIHVSDHAKKTRRQQVERRRAARRERDGEITHGEDGSDVVPF